MNSTILQQILIRLLFMTPIGYFISIILATFDSNRVSGLRMTGFDGSSPFTVNLSKHITWKDRVGWLTSALFLFVEAWWAYQLLLSTHVELDSDTPVIFVLFIASSFVFGVVAGISAFYPKFPWNRRLL